jgi:hypothetical protein
MGGNNEQGAGRPYSIEVLAGRTIVSGPSRTKLIAKATQAKEPRHKQLVPARHKPEALC